MWIVIFFVGRSLYFFLFRNWILRVIGEIENLFFVIIILDCENDELVIKDNLGEKL